MAESTKCVVVGGGPAGMVLGLLLARAGVEVEVTVLEKHADFLRDFRGDTVHPSTLTLLDELGLGEKFAAVPHSEVNQVGFPLENDGVLVLADLARLKVPHPYIAMVPQWDFLDMLAEAGRAEPKLTLRMSTEMTGLIRANGRVTGIRYRTTDGTGGTEGAEGELRADLTVAADGRWSLARREAGLTPKEYDTPFDAWWFRLPRKEGDRGGTITPQMGDGRFGVALPRTGYYQISLLAPKGRDLRPEGVEAFRDQVAAIYPMWADRVNAITSMDDVKFLDVRLNHLRRWHLDGLLCIGDAAHAMSPVGGVGVNLAVQDAVATAALLAAPLLRGRPRPAELAKVRARRRMPTAVVQAMQRMMHHAVLGPVMARERNGPPAPLVKLLTRLPGLSIVPAYLIGIGLRPEHAPEFARRATEPVRGS